MSLISLIHPSRGRPQKSKETISKWLQSAMDIHQLELIVSCDLDDPKLSEYESIYQNTIFRDNLNPYANENSSCVDAINYAAQQATGDIFIVVSDDTACFPGWDAALLKEVENKTDWILKTQDGIQPWIITMPAMDRAYYNRFGYIYHPSYKHLFADTELTCVADITGRKLTSNLLFPHNHYSIGKTQIDDVYRKNDATNVEGERIFLERYTRNFDLPKGGKIQGQAMIDWLKKRHALV